MAFSCKMHRVAPIDAKDNLSTNERPRQRRGVKEFFRKYFLEGQKLDEAVQNEIDFNRKNLPFHEKYRKFIAVLIPFIFFQLCWWSLAIRYDLFQLFPTRYALSVTMVFGAFIAGSTSEGGGAVAFPVMTLLLHISPEVSRDYSLMIQSVGMASSSFAIMWMKIKIEYHSIIFSSLGAALSIILGVQFWDDVLTGPQKKMIFVSIWFSFAISLLILNLQRKRIVYDSIPHFNWWKALVLFGTGFFGGLLSAFSGSGVDICSFSMLTLLFRVSEKVATPTSVILMFLNTCVGFYWRQLMMSGISTLAWEYFAVSVPVVVTMSPIGAFVSSHVHRQVLAVFIYVLETAALIGFLVTRPAVMLVIVGAIIIAIGTAFFFGISQLGRIISDRIESKRLDIHDASTSSPQQNSTVSSTFDLGA
ncbi:Protein of unknown function DUF81 domain containing protein [Aphelenchoides bicaudatus]|nr:Protein of unknown function DUF81 domain containing protein [Aphelenchoides bicaudatus]